MNKNLFVLLLILGFSCGTTSQKLSERIIKPVVEVKEISEIQKEVDDIYIYYSHTVLYLPIGNLIVFQGEREEVIT